jgi:hypothetical protein
MIFICANLELRYPETYGVCLGGSANAPAVIANIAAPDSAVGMKACEATIMDLTFVFDTVNGAPPTSVTRKRLLHNFSNTHLMAPW